MGFGTRIFVWLSAVILLLCAAGLTFAVTEADIAYLKGKVEAGQMLTPADIALAEEVNATTTSYIDVEQANERAKAIQAGEVETPRPPRDPLDVYVWTEVAYSWVDISGLGSTLTAGDDSNQGPFPLGFTFSFYDRPYTQVRICTNGFLSFTSTSTSFTNTALPTTALPNNAIYPFWDDLDSDPRGQIRYYSDVANQRFIVSWLAVAHHQASGGDRPAYTFQVILNANGNIVFNYHTIPTDTIPGDSSCTVGIEDSTGTQAVQVCYNGQGTVPTSERSILIGQPDGVPNPVTTLQGQVQSGDVVLTWTDPNQDTNGNPMTVDSLVARLGAVRLGRINAGVQTYTHVGPPSGNLTYAVIAYNDGFSSTPTTVPVMVGNPSYRQSFDTTNGGWVRTPVSGGWEWGAPSGPSPTPRSAPNVWGTILWANYMDNACWQLDLNLGRVITSPVATVEFWSWYNTQTGYDGCNFKVSTDGGSSWNIVAPEGGYPTASMYTGSCLAAQPAWSGNRSTWTFNVIPVGQFIGQAPIFRFEFGSNASTSNVGFYFDDITIWGLQDPGGVPRAVTNLLGSYDAERNDVTLTWTDPNQDLVGNPLTPDSIQIWLGPVISGQLLGSVAGGVQEFSHENPPWGNITYSVRAYEPPNYGAPASYSLIAGSPTYNNGFEVDDGMWIADTGWEWGTPTGVGPGGAHGGVNCWGTVLSGNYINNACYRLTLNLGLVVESPGATVEFWYWYDTEPTWDGCTFQISLDEGTTWQVGRPLGGYPDSIYVSTARPCNSGLPAWGGHAGGQWAYAVIPIGQYIGQAPIFRFLFGSDNISAVYAGFYFDDMLIWGLAMPQSASVSGTVTLDGRNGVVTNSTMSSNGLGSPNTHPLVNGTYTLAGVQVGTRVLTCELSGFQTTTRTVDVPVGGLTDQNFTIRRLPPPTPTDVTGTVNSTTGVVTLNWTASPDTTVDRYRIYRKLRSDTAWVFRRTISGRTTIQGTDTLTLGGIYNFRMTAVDTNVIAPPVESAPSNIIEIVYGELPPEFLTANGNFDNQIVLSWLSPGTPPEAELFYDSADVDYTGCVTDGLGFTQAFPFAWFAGHYQTAGAITVTRVKTRHWPNSTPGCPVQYGVFADSGGVPTLTPMGVTDWTIQTPTAWQDCELSTPVTIPNGSFYVGIRQMTAQRVDIGMDECAAQQANTFFAVTQPTGPWQELGAAGFPEVLVMRAVVIGNVRNAIELLPTPVEPFYSSWPVAKAPGE
ncbi:hypothetical protein KKH27_03040, partial [bacterium]|nr:hypothetical protein [bacterium]MBU1984201.1 hypothetical protein [bacterium]